MLHCELRNTVDRIGLLAPISGIELSDAGVLTLIPATNVNPSGEEDGEEEQLGIDLRAAIRNDLIIRQRDRIQVKAVSLSQNETLTVWVRGQDAPLIIANESAGGVTMTVTDE